MLRSQTIHWISHTRSWIVLLAAATLVTLMAPSISFATDTAYVRIEADGLEDLGAGWAYEGWLIVDGAAVSSGIFTVASDGSLSQTRFAGE